MSDPETVVIGGGLVRMALAHGLLAYDLDMLSTCFNVCYMTAMIQIRNVPDALHRRLKPRAAWQACRSPTTSCQRFGRWLSDRRWMN